MKQFTVYNKTTGAFVKTLEMSSADDIELNINKKLHTVVEGIYPESTSLTSSGSIVEATASVTLEEIRTKRTHLLKQSDWTQMPDADLSDQEKDKWKVYRQALRDITENVKTTTDPSKLVWPKEPR